MQRESLLDELVDDRRPPITEPVIVVVAHPDDEVIGMGAQLRRLRNVMIVHITDGSPTNLLDAQHAGFCSARDYAMARRAELECALALAGIPPSHALELYIRDQEAVLSIIEATHALRDIIDRQKPCAVFTHPFEGGHPDHDATACAVHAACALLHGPQVVFEMTSYHRMNGKMATGEFLPPAGKVWTVSLADDEAELKQRMFECYQTQARVLRWIPIGSERFRIAPRYDFTARPHAGLLHYESLDFGMTGERFCSLAKASLSQLGLHGRI